jgi:tetratricopeptide (TPR) repeat protein
VLAAGGAVLLAPFAAPGARAATASGGATAPLSDSEAAARLDYVMQHPHNVDMAAAAHLRLRAQSLAKQYDLAASTSLLPAAGECLGQVMFLGKQAPDGPVLRELQATEAQLATLMGQLVWDASQRRDHATAVGYYDQAIAAANRAGETTAEAYARLRKSYVALYGEQEPQVGLQLAQQAVTLAEAAMSHALQGLALLHAGEGYALLGMRRDCEAALGAAEAHRQALQAADPAHGLFSADRLGRIQGSCYLALGDSARPGRSWRAPHAAFRAVTSRRQSFWGIWPSPTSANATSTRPQPCSTGPLTCSRYRAAGAASTWFPQQSVSFTPGATSRLCRT